MVVVERGPLFEPQIVTIAVVAIVIQQGDVFGTQAIDDAAHNRGFSRP